MNLYSQMQSVAGPSSSLDEPVQRELQSLLRQLGWSYVALWTFNRQTSRLEWRGGHFRVNSTATTVQGDTEAWNEHLFNSTYKSCTFTAGQGSVGTAYAEARNIWMNGSSVHHSAGSTEQAQFLQHAGIETAVCIPWAETVLELGTSKTVAEDLDLTTYMCIFLSENILKSFAQAPTSLATTRAMTQSGPFPSLNLTRHLSDKFLDQDFELSSLNEQIRRSSSLSSLNTDMFLQPEDQPQAGKDLDSGTALTDPRWRSLPGAAPPLPPPNQAMRVQHSNTTSSSVSISEDGSVRLSPRNTPTHSPENLAVPIPVEDDLQQAISHMLEEGDPVSHWRSMCMNQEDSPSVVNVLPTTSRRGPAFRSWRHPRVQAAPFVNRPNQALLRRCIHMLKLIPTLQQASSTPAPDLQSLQGPRMTSSSASPEVELPDIGFADDPFDPTAPIRGQRRPRGTRTGTTGPVNPTHDEAATNHMMAERRRRIKQKENFSALRKLVPIISKADKASILGDAIVYIKDLQERLSNLETSRAQTETRYETLKRTSEELEQRNQELEAMVAGSGITSSHMNTRSTRLQSSRQSV